MNRRNDSNPVDDALAGHYQSQSLAPDTLERLTALTVAADQQQSITRTTRRRALMVSGFAVAAALLFAAGVSLRDKQTNKPGTDGPHIANVAKEIALNHNKQLNIEYHTQHYASLPSLMRKLDFSPKKPTTSSCAGSTLLGGRYCSIGSAIACQLKLRSSDGSIQTLYQTRWAKTYAHLANRTVVIDGVRVRFWRQRDVLFGLASSLPANR